MVPEILLAASTSSDQDTEQCQATKELRPHLRPTVVLTLGYCYHSRLVREQRAGYRQHLFSVWREMLQAKPSVKWPLSSEEDLMQTIEDTQNPFVEPMDLGEDIALNEALHENLFMLLVSIMNQVPILVIDKPGCSKSLAVEVLQNNLNDEVSMRNSSS